VRIVSDGAQVTKPFYRKGWFVVVAVAVVLIGLCCGASTLAIILLPSSSSTDSSSTSVSTQPATGVSSAEPTAAAPPVSQAPAFDVSKLAQGMEEQWGEAGSFVSPPRHVSWFPDGLSYKVSPGQVVVETPLYSKDSNKTDAWKLGSETALLARDLYGFASVHVQVLAKNGDLLATADVTNGTLVPYSP
jgi:hypothetical protein